MIHWWYFNGSLFDIQGGSTCDYYSTKEVRVVLCLKDPTASAASMVKRLGNANLMAISSNVSYPKVEESTNLCPQ